MTMKIIYINIMHHFNHQRTMKMYLQDHNMIHRNKELVIRKTLSWIYYKTPKEFWMEGIIDIFGLENKKLSSQMAQISEHINSSNHNIHSYDKTRNMIVNLGSKNGKNYNNSYWQLTCLYNSLLMSILTTLKRIYPMLIWKYDMRKVRKY